MGMFQIFIYVIVLVVAILTFCKRAKREDWDGEEVLENILEQILRLSTSSLQILKEDRGQYESESEFRLKLAQIVAEDVRVLLEETGTPDYLLNVLTTAVISDFIVNAYKLYEKEVGLIDVEAEFRTKQIKLAQQKDAVMENQVSLTDISHIFVD